MKLLGRLSVVLAAALFLLSVLVFSQAVGAREARKRTEEEPLRDTNNAYSYILKSENGHVMLYRSGSTQKPEELAIAYYDLPPEDRALLDSGITISDERQLLSVIEDYTN